VEIDKFLANVRCCRPSRFLFLKLRDPIAKSFDNSLGSDPDIDVHRSTDPVRRIEPCAAHRSFRAHLQHAILSASLKWADLIGVAA
jgi:hypothetical protein